MKMNSITKRDFFIYSVKKELHLTRYWLIKVLAIPNKTKNPDVPFLSEDGKKVLVEMSGEVFVISDAIVDESLYSNDERVTLPKTILTSIKTEEIETTYRVALLNLLIFISVFDDKIEYINDIFNASKVDAVVNEHLRKDITQSADEYKKHMKVAGFIEVLSEFCIPTTTERLLRPSKKAIEVRDRLLEEHKDELTNPTTIAKIDAAIVEVLEEEIKGDEAEGFFSNRKMLTKIRKASHGMVGGVIRLDDPTKTDIIPRSLIEGYRPEDLPAAINQLRAGSFDRGSNIALAGVAAKRIGGATQSIAITSEDCGSTNGKTVLVTDNKMYEGRYIVGKNEALTKEDLSKLIGSTIVIRSPLACLEPDGNYCKVCMGKKDAESSVGIGSRLMAMAGVFTGVFLSLFHGKEFKTADYDITKHIE